MEFHKCKVKSIRADIANGEITISFGLSIDSKSLAIAAELANYADKNAGHVEVQVTPQQLPLIKE
jgi:hypothetical protein